MKAERRPAGPDRGGFRRMRAMRLGVLIGFACGLGAYLLLGTAKTDNGPAARLACADGLAPPVQQVGPEQLGPLREAVARVLPQRLGRLYEEGTIVSLDAWRDDDPSAPPIVRGAARPAAYEMRWWAPNNDDVVADVFSFATTRRAASFIARAASGRCRDQAQVVSSLASPGPPQARNLTWVNPDAFLEADVYLQRGARVYRIADVPAGQTKGAATDLDLSSTLRTIDALACLLPQARCERGSNKVVPA